MRRGLPLGCELCLRGGKLVLFVTGVCGQFCFYCPLGEGRKGLDVIYADEVRVEDDLYVILEGRAIDAEGTGITGGDPVVRLGRTLRYIRLLKGFFGRDHHIHLYTNGRHINPEGLRRLKAAGLDELRFHPRREDWGKIELAKGLGICTGVEIPAIPGTGGAMRELVSFLERAGADFLNLNQLEFCPTNALQLKQRGFVLAGGDAVAAVSGSEEEARSLIEWAEREGISVPIHYCSSADKDAVQIRRRLIRRSRNVARPYEEVSEDGLLGKYVVRPAGPVRCTGPALRREAARALGIPPYMVGSSPDKGALEMSRDAFRSAGRILPISRAEYVQEYPTYKRERFAAYPL